MNIDKKEILKMLEINNGINPDDVSFAKITDTVSVGCASCGECCRNRNDILLKSADLYSLCKGLNMELEDFLLKYCSMHYGQHSNILVVSIKFKEDIWGRSKCPFLKCKEGVYRCDVHAFKPNICRIYPFGRFSVRETTADIEYLLQKQHCAAKDVKKDIKVIDWIGDNYLLYEENFKKFNDLMIKLRNKIELKKLLSSNLTEEQQLQIFNCMINCLYKFDLNKTLEENINSDYNLKQVDLFVDYIANNINKKFIK